MTDSRELQIQPTPGVVGASRVLPVRSDKAVGTPGKPPVDAGAQDAAATTGGNLRAAYAQFVFDVDTHDVVLRVRDSATDEVLSEFPSAQIQAMSKSLRDYAETLARQRLALRGESAT
jgi:hypothetical protein